MSAFRIGQLVKVVEVAPHGRGGVTVEKGTPATVCATWVMNFDFPEVGLSAGTRIYDIELDDGREASAPAEWLEPYHEPGDYQTLDELLRGVVPAGKVDA